MKIDTTPYFFTDTDLETARAIVKRCGIRDGLFKGPRTQNAVESIAYALAASRKQMQAACVVRLREKAAEYQQARDDAYAGEPRCDAVGENEIRHLVAFNLAAEIESLTLDQVQEKQ